MAESDNMKEIVYKVAVKAPMAVMMTLRDVEAGPQLTTEWVIKTTETEPWWASTCENDIQLGCTGQVCSSPKFQKGSI